MNSNENRNPEKGESQDATLRQVLHTWKLDAPLPPRFEEGVWNRIASSEADAVFVTPLTALRLWLRQMALKPAFAVSYAAILLGLGIAGGFWQSQVTAQRDAEAMSTRYVQMIDPYQMPRH